MRSKARATSRLMSAAGALDTTFNGVGYVTTDLVGYDDEVHALVIQSDGKIVVGGSAGKNGSGASGFGLTRYTTGGALDTTYSGDGIVTDHRGFESHLLRFYILESFFAASVPSMALPRHNPRGALSLLLMLLLLAVTGCDAAETTAADDGASDEAAAIEHLSKIITWQSDVLAHHSDPFLGRIHTDYLTAYRQAMEVDGLDYVHE